MNGTGSEASPQVSVPIENADPVKISIAMTTYNGGRFLCEQLDSIFAQSRLPDEIIICDDGSTDRTAQLLHEYVEHSPCSMKVVVNDERLGSIKNFEKAIELCSGDVIALCDQDDVWRPQKLATLESAFAADPELGVVLTNADLIDENGASLPGDLWTRSRLTAERKRDLSGPRRYDLLFGLPFTTGATMAFRSKFKPLVFPIPTGAPTFHHDRWIAVLIAAVGRISIIEEKLIAYRLHERQQLGVGRPLALKFFIPQRSWSDSAALSAMDERLGGNRFLPADPEFQRSLVERRNHVAARASLSRNPFLRLKQVATEYATGRYTLYPYGRIMALQDLLLGTAAKATSPSVP